MRVLWSFACLHGCAVRTKSDGPLRPTLTYIGIIDCMICTSNSNIDIIDIHWLCLRNTKKLLTSIDCMIYIYIYISICIHYLIHLVSMFKKLFDESIGWLASRHVLLNTRTEQAVKAAKEAQASMVLGYEKLALETCARVLATIKMCWIHCYVKQPWKPNSIQ